MPTYQVVTPGGVVTHPCPETLPEPGQTFIVQRPFITGGGHTYRIGQLLTLLERTAEAPYGYASSLGNWKVRCPYRESVWSGIEEMIANRTLAPESPVDQAEAEVLEGIRSILSAYYLEMGVPVREGLMGDLPAQVSELVRSHRNIRDNFRSVYGEYKDARKKGYEDGVKMGEKATDSQYIALASLKMMTLGEISNLLQSV